MFISITDVSNGYLVEYNVSAPKNKSSWSSGRRELKVFYATKEAIAAAMPTILKEAI